MTTKLLVCTSGRVCYIYDESIDLACLGHLQIRRASHVEADRLGQWWVMLGPVAGPTLGPFALRSLALEAETDWLSQRLPELAAQFPHSIEKHA